MHCIQLVGVPDILQYPVARNHLRFSSSTNSCDPLPPGGSVVTFESELLFSGFLLLPAPAGILLPTSRRNPAPGIFGASTPSIACTGSYRAPLEHGNATDGTRFDFTTTNWTNRTTAPGTDRSVLRKGRLHQITTTGKEGCGTGGDTLAAVRKGNPVINLGNRRSPCRKDC